MGNAGFSPSWVQDLLVPGVVVASFLRLGGHDIGMVGVVVIVNGVVYGTVAFLVRLVAQISVDQRR